LNYGNDLTKDMELKRVAENVAGENRASIINKDDV
jgi:hypothetical protein